MKIFNRLDNYINDKKFSMIYKNNKLDYKYKLLYYII